MVCLKDSFNRPISYLRVSVTDRCNFRCTYCIPSGGVAFRPHHEILTYEEITRVVEAAAALGVCKVRLTGGEPLAREGIVRLVEMLAGVPGIDDLALSTNGALLSRYAPALKAAGLRRVNVSLDTLRPERFAQVTGVDRLPQVLRGIEAAVDVGLTPIKINTVVVRGVNDDEIPELAARTIDREWHVRFIELMPTAYCAEPNSDKHVPMAEMKRSIEQALGPLEPGKLDDGGIAYNGPARYYRLAGAQGTIGFISPISKRFCEECNRLRLTADGKLRPCLMWDDEIDLKSPLRNGASRDDIKDLIGQAARVKPWSHRLDENYAPLCRGMSEIGG